MGVGNRGGVGAARVCATDRGNRRGRNFAGRKRSDWRRVCGAREIWSTIEVQPPNEVQPPIEIQPETEVQAALEVQPEIEIQPEIEVQPQIDAPAAATIEAQPEATLAPIDQAPATEPEQIAPGPLVEPVFAPDEETAADHSAQSLLKDDLDADLLPVFLEEGRDMLPQLGQELRAWQNNPSDLAAPHATLRLLHTLKGSARMAGAMNLGQHMHEMETRIEQVSRSGYPSAAALDDMMTRYDQGLQLFEELLNPQAARQAPASKAVGAAPQSETSAPAEAAREMVELKAVVPTAAATNLAAQRLPAIAKAVAPAAPVPLGPRARRYSRPLGQSGR